MHAQFSFNFKPLSILQSGRQWRYFAHLYTPCMFLQSGGSVGRMLIGNRWKDAHWKGKNAQGFLIGIKTLLFRTGKSSLRPAVLRFFTDSEDSPNSKKVEPTPWSQCFPLKPRAQRHLYPSRRSWQVAPFWQGLLSSHSLTSLAGKVR